LASNLQIQVAQSTIKADFIAVSTELRHVTVLMSLLEDARAQGIPNFATISQKHRRVLEDISGAMELTRVPKM
jgi:hypothetical protein